MAQLGMVPLRRNLVHYWTFMVQRKTAVDFEEKKIKDMVQLGQDTRRIAINDVNHLGTYVYFNFMY